MAVAIQGSYAKKGTAIAATITSDSFTAPAGSRIWAFVGWDSFVNDMNMLVDSAPTLTWNMAAESTLRKAAGHLFWADVGGGGFTGTVTASPGTGYANYAGQSLYIFVVTGGETTPVAATLVNGTTGFTLPTLDYTATATGSILLAFGTDWNGTAFDESQMLANNTLLDQNDVGSAYADGVWRLDGTTTASTVYPMGLAAGATKSDNVLIVQELRVGASGPTVTAELYEGGTLKQSLGSSPVTADGVLSFTWNAATLTAISGANVELRLTSDADVDIGAIEWNAVRVPSTGPPPLAATASGASTSSGTAAARKILGASASGSGTRVGSAAAIRSLRASASGAGTRVGTAAALVGRQVSASAARVSAGTVAAVRKLTLSSSGARTSAGGAAAVLAVSAAASAARASTGTAAAVRSLRISASATGRLSAGAAAVLVTFRVIAAGARTSSGTAAALRFRYVEMVPDAILTQTNMSGVVAAVQDDPDAPDGTWTDGGANSVLRVSFPLPSGPVLTAMPQKFRVRVRPGS